MKILPLRPMSTLDKAKNLINIICKTSKHNNTEKKIKVIKSEITQDELRSMYNNARKRLNFDKYDNGDK